MDNERADEYGDEGSPYAVCPMCHGERGEYEWVCMECQDEMGEGDDE